MEQKQESYGDFKLLKAKVVDAGLFTLNPMYEALKISSVVLLYALSWYVVTAFDHVIVQFFNGIFLALVYVQVGFIVHDVGHRQVSHNRKINNLIVEKKTDEKRRIAKEKRIKQEKKRQQKEEEERQQRAKEQAEERQREKEKKEREKERIKKAEEEGKKEQQDADNVQLKLIDDTVKKFDIYYKLIVGTVESLQSLKGVKIPLQKRLLEIESFRKKLQLDESKKEVEKLLEPIKKYEARINKLIPEKQKIEKKETTTFASIKKNNSAQYFGGKRKNTCQMTDA